LTRLNSLLLAGDDEAARQYWRSSGLEQDPEAMRELGPRIAEIEHRRRLRDARGATVSGDSAPMLDLWEKGQLGDSRPAEPLKPVVATAKRRAELIERVKAAIEAQDAKLVIELWPEVRSEPAASPLAIKAHTLIADWIGTEIADALARQDDRAILNSIQRSDEAGIAVSTAARQAARAAKDRNAIRRELEEALANDDREALASLAISGRLEQSGQVQPSHMQLVVRALAWPHLLRALESDDDAAIVACYDSEVFALRDSLSDEQRARIDLAKRRLAWLESIRTSLKKRDLPGLRAALTDIPPGADTRLSRVERKRIERLSSQDVTVRHLHSAIQRGSDGEILDALSELEAAGVPLPDAIDWTTVRGVFDRVSLAASIRRAASSDPPDYARLSRLLPLAKAAAGDSEPDLGSDLDLQELEDEVRRWAQRTRLREALALDDDKAIVAAALPDLYDTLSSLPPGERARVDRAIKNQRRGAMAASTR
jgi:hypothetical protein